MKCKKVLVVDVCPFCDVFGFMSNLVWCVVAAIQSQWLSMKVLVHSQFRKKVYSGLWAILLTKAPYKDDLKDALYLVEILLVLPLSAAQCE